MSISMKLQCIDRTASAPAAYGERGIVVPLLALCIFVLVGMVGLAVDGGRLYISRVETQNAAQAAAYSSAAIVALHNHDFNNLNAILINYAQTRGVALALQNLRFGMKGTSNPAAAVKITKGAGKILVESKAEVSVPLYFVRAFPGVGPRQMVRAEAHSEITPSLGVLALDSSGSMNCPGKIDADCSCFPDCGTDAGKKFSEVLSVVDNAFLSKFDRKRDQIAVLMYDKTVHQLVYIDPGGGFTGSTQPADANKYIQAVKQFDATNIALGLRRGFEIVDPEFQIHPDRVPFVAIMSDGAPTATCMKPYEPNSTVSPEFDNAIACFWEVMWEGYFDPSQKDAKELYKPGISRIGRAQNFLSVPEWEKNEPPFNPAACSTLTFPPWGGPDNAGPDEDAEDEIGKCLQTYGFSDMDDFKYPLISNTDTLENFSLKDKNGSAVNNWRKVFYHTAIAEADSIRRHGYALFTIGLGASSANDEYNGLSNVMGLKTNMLERMALQYGQGQDFKGLASWSSLIDKYNHAKGEYYEVKHDDPASLAEQFKRLVWRVKLRNIR